jgi:hypothetical protein
MQAVAVNMSICGRMINNKANVFVSGMEVVKAMEIDSKLNNNVKKRALVRKASVRVRNYEDNINASIDSLI